MFLLDTLMIAGLRWTLRTIQSAAEAEMNDDAALRERLLEAEMQRESGQMTDEEFAGIERDLLARIREIRERREGGTGPIVFGRDSDAGDGQGRISVEASLGGDFHAEVLREHDAKVTARPRRSTARQRPTGGARRRARTRRPQHR